MIGQTGNPQEGPSATRSSSDLAWPTTDGSPEQELEAFKARLAETAAARARADSSDPRLDDVDARFFDAYYNVLCGQVSQSRSAAETVQRAAAAVSALYGTALGVAFSVTNNPLPARAIMPLLFLGLAIVTSTVYLSWQGGGRPITGTHPERESDSFLRNRGYIVDFAGIVADYVYRRVRWLRAAIVALAAGLILLPVPFVQVDTRDTPVLTPPPGGAAGVASVSPAWPAVDATQPAGTDPQLRATLYAYQVAEVARERQRQFDRAAKARPAPSLRVSWLPETGWVLLTGLLLAAVALVGLRAHEKYRPPPPKTATMPE